MPLKVWFAIAAEAAVFAALLFGGAGTLLWPAGWAFLALFFGAVVLLTLSLAKHDPALLGERMRPFFQKGQAAWDRALMPVIALVFIGWLALMGVDAVRFRWTHVPPWLEVLGAAGVALSMGACHRVLRENTFLVNVVKIQADRGHRVVTTGPYAVVRHPFYAGALVMFPSIALMLGSLWGLAGAGVLAAGLAVRTALEDRELHRKLDGYAEYARKVRYRLVPGVW